MGLVRTREISHIDCVKCQAKYMHLGGGGLAHNLGLHEAPQAADHYPGDRKRRGVQSAV